jgi:hypothetical protein
MVAVRRAGATLIPRGNTRLVAGDRVTVIAGANTVDRLKEMFRRPRGRLTDRIIARGSNTGWGVAWMSTASRGSISLWAGVRRFFKLEANWEQFSRFVKYVAS